MMKIMKKVLVSVLVLAAFNPLKTIAEEESYDKTEYWDEYCNKSENAAGDKCAAYWTYQVKALQKEQQRNRDKIKQLQKDSDEAFRYADLLAEEVEELNTQVNNLRKTIKQLENEIKRLDEEIKTNEAQKERLDAQVLGRMRAKQGKMHFNPFLDFLFGSTSFADMLRRSYGLTVIMNKDKEIRFEIEDLIKKIAAAKAEVEANREAVKKQEQVVEARRKLAEEKRKQQMTIAKEAAKKVAELQNAQEEIIERVDELIDKLDDKLAALEPNSYLMHPVKNSWISAGFPYYPADFGGGIHLGVDYAARIGTKLFAPANGIILKTANCCDTWGYYGSSCGYQAGGVAGGGNQLHMIMAAGGKIYGLIIFHIKKDGLVVERGDVVKQGDLLAYVGTSGNSTGPHAHIELFDLGMGDQSDLTAYAAKTYRLGFGCGWGSWGLKHICSRGASVPCRLDGRDYFR